MRLPYRFIGGFKGLLFALAVAIMVGVILYTEAMVSELRDTSRRYLAMKVERFKLLFQQGDDTGLEQYLTEMAEKDFPLIVADASHQPLSWSGLPELDKLPDAAALKRAALYQRDWQRRGNQPVLLEIPQHNLKFYYYYGDSEQILRLRMLPWIEVILVGGLILIGYFGFVHIKQSEERSVWVGMARETAHQLGTPLTSLLGWNELLAERPSDPRVRDEITRDLERLQTVAERFNRIGSTAPLEEGLLKPLIDDAADYIRRRLPQMGREGVRLETEVPDALAARVHSTLFGWVIENLLKNGVEALKGGGGSVTVKAAESGGRVLVEVMDTGCGIPRRQWKNVFRPGYTTKQRGWGLGLSLCKRIVRDLHGGHIYIAQSQPDAGTTVRVELKG